MRVWFLLNSAFYIVDNACNTCYLSAVTSEFTLCWKINGYFILNVFEMFITDSWCTCNCVFNIIIICLGSAMWPWSHTDGWTDDHFDWAHTAQQDNKCQGGSARSPGQLLFPFSYNKQNTESNKNNWQLVPEWTKSWLFVWFFWSPIFTTRGR